MYRLDPAVRAGMYQLNDVISRVAKTVPPGAVEGAYVMYMLRDVPVQTAQDKMDVTTLAGRIATIDESTSAYSHAQYAAGVVHTPGGPDVAGLLDMDDERFHAVLDALARHAATRA